MIALEIIVTLVAALITLILSIVLIKSSAQFRGHMIFGVIVFAGFTGWAYYLLKQDFLEWAAASAVFALLAIVMPFIVCRGRRRKGESTDRSLDRTKHVKESQPRTADLSSSALTAETPSRVAKTAAAVQEQQAIPEDSVLRRHYLAQLQAEQEALTNPYPTDSVLKRHYDTMVKALLGVERPVVSQKFAVATRTETVSEAEGKIPQDSVLRRHYLTQQQAEQEALTNPYPTDSVLRRHYDTMVMGLLGTERPVVSQNSAVTAEVETVSKAPSAEKLPQDSVLRRHFVSHIRSEVEAGLFPRPTDAVLQRHFDTLVEYELENRLAQMDA